MSRVERRIESQGPIRTIAGVTKGCHSPRNNTTQLESELLANGIMKIVLAGRLDIAGARDIEMKFTALKGTRNAAVPVDMSGIDFMASIGVRTLISGARAQLGRGGKLVLLKPHAPVRGVLEPAGITSLIPVFDTVADVEAALAAAL